MKRLYKSRKNKMIAGVCGGIAEYFDVDPVLIRLIAVLFFFTGGATLIAYIVGMIVMSYPPYEGAGESEAAQGQNAEPATCASGESHAHAGSVIIGVLLILFGVHFLFRNIPFFHPYYWWFWDVGWRFFWPSVLIAAGLLVILQGRRKL